MRPLQVTVGHLLNSLGRADVYGRVSMILLAAACRRHIRWPRAWAASPRSRGCCWRIWASSLRRSRWPPGAMRGSPSPIRLARYGRWPPRPRVSWAVTRAIATAADAAPAAVALGVAVAGCLAVLPRGADAACPGSAVRRAAGCRRALGLVPAEHGWRAARRACERRRWSWPPRPGWGRSPAADPKLAVALVAGGLLLALPFVAPVAHLVLLLLVTAIVPFDLQNTFAFGGGPGSPGVLPSDVLLLGGLARAALVLLDTPLERRSRAGRSRWWRPCSRPPPSACSTG